MADFNSAFNKTLKHEGGYVCNSDDIGGETYKGVARKYHSKWEGWGKLDEHKGSPDFPKGLDEDQNLQNMR